MSDDYRKRASARAKTIGKRKGFALGEGPTSIRIGPTPPDKKGKDDIFLEYNVHKNVGSAKQWLRCGHDKGQGGSCLTCDKEIPKLEKKGKDTRAAALAKSPMLAVNASKVSDEMKFSPFELWCISAVSLQRMVLGIVSSTKRDYVHPKKGYCFTITRTGTTQTNTRYTGPEADEEKSQVPQKYVDALMPFSKDKGIPKYDEEAMKKALYGEASKDEDEDDDDDGDDISLDEDDDDEPKFKKKKKTKKSKDEDEDDDETEDDDDDDDDEDDDDED